MAWAPASLLLHQGWGPAHLDIILGLGARCPTLRILPGRQPGCWQGTWSAPHRRTYLTYQGPVGGGRGVVRRLWQGRARWCRRPGGWRVELAGLGILTLRGESLAVPAGPATIPPWPTGMPLPTICWKPRPRLRRSVRR